MSGTSQAVKNYMRIEAMRQRDSHSKCNFCFSISVFPLLTPPLSYFTALVLITAYPHIAFVNATEACHYHYCNRFVCKLLSALKLNMLLFEFSLTNTYLLICINFLQLALSSFLFLLFFYSLNLFQLSLLPYHFPNILNLHVSLCFPLGQLHLPYFSNDFRHYFALLYLVYQLVCIPMFVVRLLVARLLPPYC